MQQTIVDTLLMYVRHDLYLLTTAVDTQHLNVDRERLDVDGEYLNIDGKQFSIDGNTFM